MHAGTCEYSIEDELRSCKNYNSSESVFLDAVAGWAQPLGNLLSSEAAVEDSVRTCLSTTPILHPARRRVVLNVGSRGRLRTRPGRLPRARGLEDPNYRASI